MKVYLVFRLKDPSSRKKDFIVDSVYTEYYGALRRMERITKTSATDLISANLNEKFFKVIDKLDEVKDCKVSSVYKSKINKQQVYMINKTLKGLLPNGK